MREYTRRWRGVLRVGRASVVSAAAFWFTWSFSVALLEEFFINEANAGFYNAMMTIAAVVGAMAAGFTGGTLATAPRVTGACVSAILSLCLASGLIYPLTRNSLAAIDLSGSVIPAWGLGIVAAVSVIGTVVSYRRFRPLSMGTEATKVASEGDPGHFQQVMVRGHYALLAGAWVVGGFISMQAAPIELGILGAVVFVLYSYPRFSHLPRVRFGPNLPILLPALFFALLPFRDLPYLLRDEAQQVLRVNNFYEGWYHRLLPVWISTDAAATCAGAIALVAIISTLANYQPPPHFLPALRRGGAAMLLLVWPAFIGYPAQHLPLALLLLLYVYYLSANTESIRPLFRAIILGSCWVPLVGLGQYGWQYLAQWRTGGAPPPIWVYRLGVDDPLMWPTSVGMTLAVLLPLLYGLYYTAPHPREKRFLKVLAILLFTAMILTFCRSAWLSMLAVVAVGSVWIGKKKRWWILAVFLAVLCSAVFAQLTGRTHLERFLGRESSTAVRVAEIQLAREVLAEHPWFGIAPIAWNLRWRALGHQDMYGIGGMVVGWLQVPVESGVIGVVLFLLMAVAFGRKVQCVIRRTTNAGERLLLQCAALGIISVIVSNLTEVTLLQEGHYSLPILLGAILGWGRARQRQMEQALHSSIELKSVAV